MYSNLVNEMKRIVHKEEGTQNNGMYAQNQTMKTNRQKLKIAKMILSGVIQVEKLLHRL